MMSKCPVAPNISATTLLPQPPPVRIIGSCQVREQVPVAPYRKAGNGCSINSFSDSFFLQWGIRQEDETRVGISGPFIKVAYFYSKLVFKAHD
jgi:hypothetical protein